MDSQLTNGGTPVDAKPATNGPAPEAISSDSTAYVFTEKERGFFDKLQASFNNSIMTAIQVICTQQDLAGSWRIREDGTGLQRVA